MGTPVYKAAYSGLLKTFLDLLPQAALAGKQVLPPVTGGSTAHVLALDYALRPVLTSLGGEQVLRGLFVLDQHLVRDGGADGPGPGPGLTLDPAAASGLEQTVAQLTAALTARSAAPLRPEADGGAARGQHRRTGDPPDCGRGSALYAGERGTALVGSHEEVADLIEQYRNIGIEEFVLSGYPHLEECYWFGEGLLPLVRHETASSLAAAS